MRSQQELLAASGLAPRPLEFGGLLRILDTELRLIAPTDLEGAEEGGRADGHYYQLTHDYLVPALRQWLTAGQRETRRGRAELLLAERANVWNARPQQRHLPSWWEWATIRLHTRPRDWTLPQRRMMRAAGRNHLLMASVLAVLVGVLGWAAVEGSRYLRAVELVRALDSVDTAGVGKIAEDLSSCRYWADPRLTKMIEEGDARQRLHASLALLPVDPDRVNYLYDRMLDADRQPDEFWVLCQALREHRQELAERLTRFLLEESNPDQRLRAACALAFYDPRNPLWTGDTRLCDDVANKLLREPPVLAERWIEGTRALRLQFGSSFLKIASDPARSDEHARAFHLSVFCKPLEVSTEELAAFILEHDDLLLHDRVLPYLLAKDNEAVKLMSEELDKKPSSEMSEVEMDILAKRRSKAAVFLLQYDQQDGPWPVHEAGCLWPLLRDSADLRLRTCLMHRFSQVGADPETLVRQYEEEQDTGARRALLLSLGGFKNSLPAGQRQRLADRLQLLETYRHDPDTGLHSALEWLLRSWELDAELDSIDRQLAGLPAGKRRWCVNARGQTLTLLEGPVELELGSPALEAGRQADESLRRRVIPRSFAIATKEVTALQFRAFLEGIGHNWQPSERLGQDPGGPMIGVTWFQAAQYCRWLSEQEGVPEDQMCYPPLDKIKPGMEMPENYLSRTGYRLPTEAEWEYACRAHSVTSRHGGISEQLLGNYAWFIQNASGRTQPVGKKMPNDYGLFDLYGNALEWCQDAAGPDPSSPKGLPIEDREDLRGITSSLSRILRGGSCASHALTLRSAQRFELEPSETRSLAGLRVAKTIR
jgi:formylglycine-generating enzyme required for sulfatase activity